MNERLVAQLAEAGARLDGLYVCTHHPSEGEPPFRADCECRKPKPGLLLRAAAELGLDLARSTMVGDKPSDLVPARAVGAGAVLVLTGYGLGEWEYRRARLRGGARSRRHRPAGRGGLGAGAARWRRERAARRLGAIVDAMRGRTILVVGDLIVDEYLFGKPARISREAPVLILRFTEREVLLGGAANAVHNVHALGARVDARRRASAATPPGDELRRAARTPPASPPTASSPRTAG